MIHDSDAYPTPEWEEQDAVEYFYRLKWPHGFSCPSCMHWHAYTITTRHLPLYECSVCKHQTSLLAGTVMEGSRTSLGKWLLAIQLVSDPERGISALALSRIIAVSYKTAWSMLQKIRHAMGASLRSERLTGQVLIHDACYGRPHNSSVHRHPQETPVLVGAVIENDQPTHIQVTAVPKELLAGRQILSSAARQFVEQHVSVGASQVELHILRYAAPKRKLAMPLFRSACRWINRTFHGLGKKHLQAYLDEFCCRTNLQRTSSTSIFEELSRICACFGTITYPSLIQKVCLT